MQFGVTLQFLLMCIWVLEPRMRCRGCLVSCSKVMSVALYAARVSVCKPASAEVPRTYVLQGGLRLQQGLWL
jgi:hypothetical protein